MRLCIIPEPSHIKVSSDIVGFTLTGYCEIQAGQGTEKSERNLREFIGMCFEGELAVSTSERISLLLSDEEGPAQGYSLIAEKGTVTVIGNDEAGLFYGVQTLKQLLICNRMTLTECEITDSPRFLHRGFMLDCARYFFTKEAVMHFLDIMALHKLNEFHWHLSDDQGFRCLLEDNLLLTEIGAYRSHTNFNTIPHQGFYTKEDMKEIVSYAHERCIKVIPEIDTPGHSVSMIAAYPFLSCFDRKMAVATSWGVKHDVLCVGKESTFSFMESVFDELCEIFPDKLIHIGGDEVPVTRWSICPHCRERMKQENMKDVKQLHTYYLERIAAYLHEKGCEVRMWNDTVKEKMVDRSVAWQLWNGEMSESELCAEINGGRKFVISPSTAYYLNMPYGEVSLKDTYDYNPVPEGIRPENKGNVIGIEACLWTEYIPDMKKAHYHMYPRLGAFSESAWTSPENKSFDQFLTKMQSYYELMHFFGIEPAKMSEAMPSPVRKGLSCLYWKRRVLHWGGLYNLIDNYFLKKRVTYD